MMRRGYSVFSAMMIFNLGRITPLTFENWFLVVVVQSLPPIVFGGV